MWVPNLCCWACSVPVLQPIMVMDGEHTMSCKGSMRR